MRTTFIISLQNILLFLQLSFLPSFFLQWICPVLLSKAKPTTSAWDSSPFSILRKVFLSLLATYQHTQVSLIEKNKQKKPFLNK